ncbi:hypothetical protein TCAL_16655 [Tigriopus californicus]|uniref:Protein NATD1 n=1 Tax=Tigriopus californicus TaxID=6832 RepID=A0A553ND60_TIGCA|nr:hypothetical protein TCAL_16655 [Tigriopus californicus]
MSGDPAPGQTNSRYSLDPVQGRFVWWLADHKLSHSPRLSTSTASTAYDGSNTTAFLEFAWLDATTLDVFHTEVPTAWRGRGFGRSLVLSGLPALAELQPQTVVLSCSYLQHLDASGALEALKPNLPYHLKRPV